MKITTWNVAGLRALIKKAGWDWIKQHDPDVICLQEIKAMPEQITEEDHQLFSPYKALWNPADKKGYSGTLTHLPEQVLMVEVDERIPPARSVWGDPPKLHV